MKASGKKTSSGNIRVGLIFCATIAIAVVVAIAALQTRPGKRRPVLAATPARAGARDHQGGPREAAGPSSSDVDPHAKLESPNVEISSTQSVAMAPIDGVKTQAVVAAKKPSRKKVIQDPVAREALSLVGVDPDAEKYWFEALNDPNLPKSERQDLVDDLNEEGLSDPKHPTLEDLPLLVIRLRMIEALAGWAGEDLDWRESYDDLRNLVDVAMGGGKEVK